MTRTVHPPLVLVALLFLGSAARAQHTMPAGMTHEQHLAQMKAQGKEAMGFDQDATAHHFRLAPDGGSIAVDARVPGDQQTLAQVRAHLREVAAAFQRGDFAKPLMTHGEPPPGVATLERLKSQLVYVYQDSANGGVVRIITSNQEALSALHEFLKYQITEHETGDPLTVSRNR
jgi:hypothetical protein